MQNKAETILAAVSETEFMNASDNFLELFIKLKTTTVIYDYVIKKEKNGLKILQAAEEQFSSAGDNMIL